MFIRLSEVNWLAYLLPDLTKIYQAQIRYHGELCKCQIKSVDRKKRTAEIEFLDLPQALTAGQSCVVYLGQEMLGGGIITTLSAAVA